MLTEWMWGACVCTMFFQGLALAHPPHLLVAIDAHELLCKISHNCNSLKYSCCGTFIH